MFQLQAARDPHGPLSFLGGREVGMVAVAIQGEAGSFSHAAALQAFGPQIRLVPRPSFEDLFRNVEAGEAARGVVPIENSLAGSVHENYDLLGAHALHVVGEAQVRVRHCLIARPGTALAAIHRVASHPVALAQCRRFFAAHPDIAPVPAYDTAGSVRDLMGGGHEADAAIASSLAAELYGAVVLREVTGGPQGGGALAAALAELGSLARDLRVLGTYPGSDIPVAKG